MPKAKKTITTIQHDYILLDRSESMASRWSDALGGVNAYVQGLAKDPTTQDILVTVAVFDSNEPFLVLRKNVVAAKWEDIRQNEASPRGMTPLFDAIGRLVTVANSDKPDKSAIVIMTDGHENSSVEHSRDSIRKLLDQCREKNWQVIFLGADFDNMTQGADLGNAVGQTMSVDSYNMAGTMSRSSQMRGLYSATGQSMSYSAEDRAAAVAKSPKDKAHGIPADPSIQNVTTPMNHKSRGQI